jgi:glycerol-3-phosphate dehydrogenase (NAD(P)+)
MTKIGLIGAGNFGFALAYHLDRKKDPQLNLHLYDHNHDTLEHIKHTRTHPHFFPTISLSDKVNIAPDLPSLVADTQILIFAMVSTALANVLDHLKDHIQPQTIIVSVMKALDAQTGLPLTQIIQTTLKSSSPIPAVFAGGTTGKGLTKEEYLGGTLACLNPQATQTLVNLLQSPYLRLQTSTDLLGVQYAGSFKNLVSVIVGIIKGLGFDYGTQTHALSLTASECQQLALSLGAQAQTFSFASQCWGNDLVMSATSDTRNHTLGIKLGEGISYSTALAEMTTAGKTYEAANTLAVLPQIADLSPYPLLSFLIRLTHEQVSAHEIIKIIETAN